MAAEVFVCLHEISSLACDFEQAMRGYARAGITAVEPHLELAREYERLAGPGSARRLLDDLGLKAWSSSNQLHLDESGPGRLAALEDLRWKLPLLRSLGADRLVCPSVAAEPAGEEEWPLLLARYEEAADLAHSEGVMLLLEFTRHSRRVSCLRTALALTRELSHPGLGVMLDTFHFWAGPSKLEDLALLEPGELKHVHIADMPLLPAPELSAQKDRAWPGEGIIPLETVLEGVQAAGYRGPLSLELFDPQVQAADPVWVAQRALETVQPLIDRLSAAPSS